jgi:hypothetical protein
LGECRGLPIPDFKVGGSNFKGVGSLAVISLINGHLTFTELKRKKEIPSLAAITHCGTHDVDFARD